MASLNGGDLPFGAILVGVDGAVLLEAQQTVVRGRDPLGHAETNLLRMALARWRREELGGCTLYSSTEPCPMCTGAIAWSGVGRLVFGASQSAMYAVWADTSPRFKHAWDCRSLLDHLAPPMTVAGPILEDEALVPHRLHLQQTRLTPQ